MRKSIKLILWVVLGVLMAITIWVLLLWVTNSKLLYEFIFYLVWGVTIIAGILSFAIAKKYNTPRVMTNSFLVVTIFSMTLLLITGIVYLIVSSMP